ncbi:MAG: enoyl-CoA hydratase/isomerase family protein [Hyphomicrobiaceae bacterium]|nr:enoyl-CoA hydratase/isomerase family protein [Hyphomicrobiaceae bacterium]
MARVADRNAIDGAVVATLSDAIDEWARSADVYAVVVSSGLSNVFCIGSDLPRLSSGAALGLDAIAEMLAADYRLFWQIDCFTKPIVSLIHGSVAGAGLGLALHGTHRVAQEGFALSVPEVSLGMVPQAGFAYWLSRLPSYVGMYLALSGRGLGRADALAYGLMTHTIDARYSHDIQRQLADAQPVDPVLDALHRDPGPRDVDYFAPVIARCFSADSVEEIVARLNRERGQTQLWAEGVQRDIARHSPLSLKVTHRLLRQCVSLDLRQSLVITHRVLARLLMSTDFQVGLKAALIERERAPQWAPGGLRRISEQMIDQLFEPLERGALTLPERVAMQRGRARQVSER